jgi:hypothetical protein
LMEGKQDKKQKICLILTTYGGDADAGYRMARALGHHYKAVEVLIPDVCKSAGTLLCIGASKLIIGDRGELGPLDVQLSKPNEMFDYMSGLDIMQALNALSDQVFISFKKYLFDIRGGSRLTTKLAADIASKLAEVYISPMLAKLDPITYGEHVRAMQVAFEYGTRLDSKTKALKEKALLKLATNYPSHGFVIDRKEAGTLFNNVSSPNEVESVFEGFARGIISKYKMPDSYEDPFVTDLSKIPNNTTNGYSDDNEKSPSAVTGADGHSADADSGAERENERTVESVTDKDQKRIGNARAKKEKRDLS